MADFQSFNELQALSNLLNQKQNERSDSEDEEIGDNNQKSLTPGDVGQTSNKSQVSKSKYQKIQEEDKGKKREVEDPEDAFMLNENDPNNISWKKMPEWGLAYKQQVTPQDVFLQMGGKTTSTASCEDMIITVELPGEKRQNVDLKITREKLDLESPRFKLSIPLPHPVDPQQGTAEFDSNSETIKITLRMDREFDYINF